MNPAELEKLITALTQALHSSTPNADAFSGHLNINLEKFDEHSESWEIFIRRLENYFSLKGLLIHSIGTKTLQILCNLTSPEEPNTKSYKELTTILKNYLDPTPSEIAEQNQFSRRIQKDGECVADFITDLRKLSKNCQFVCASCKASTIDEHIRQLWKRHADQIKPSMPFTNRTDVTSKSENENTANSSRIPVITLPENRNEVGFEDKSGETIEKDVQKEQNTEHNDINCACNEDGSGTGKSQDQTATMIRRSSRIRKQPERFSYD